MRTTVVALAAVLALVPAPGAAQDDAYRLWRRAPYGEWASVTGVITLRDCVAAKQARDRRDDTQWACVNVLNDPLGQDHWRLPDRNPRVRGTPPPQPTTPSQCPGTSVWNGRGCVSVGR